MTPQTLREFEHLSLRDARDVFTLALFEHHLRKAGAVGRGQEWAAGMLGMDRSAFCRKLSELRKRVPQILQQPRGRGR